MANLIDVRDRDYAGLGGRRSAGIGYQIGNSMKAEDLEPNLKVLIQAIEDVIEKREPAMTEEEMRETMGLYQKAMQERKRALAEGIYQGGKKEQAFKLTSDDLTALFKPITG